MANLKSKNNPPFGIKTIPNIIDDLNAINNALPTSNVQYHEQVITSPQILNLALSPIAVLPALSSVQYYNIKDCVLEYKFNTIQYIWPDSTDAFYLSGRSGWFDFSRPIIGVNSRFEKGIYVPFGTNLTATPQVYFGTKNEDTSPTGGNGTLKLKLWYTVETIS